MDLLLKKQREYFEKGDTLDIDFRLKMLKTLRRAIENSEEAIFCALEKDLKRNRFDTYTTEIGIVYDEISYAVTNLKKWSREEKVKTPFYLFPNRSRIVKEPYGNVLIIAPWNYPFQLLFSPLVGSIAAGNTAIVKPSEISRHSADVILNIIREYFDEMYIAGVDGGGEVTTELLSLNFDYIFFTGSVAVGKIVMSSAARHLIPMTLELGGKSPVIVSSDADIESAAAKIVWGKFLNAGQTCVAPDYMLVEKSVEDRLLKEMSDKIEEYFGKNPMESPEYGKIIDDGHFKRIESLIDRNKLYYGGETNEKELYIQPTILRGVAPEDKIMENEIFGPILPVLSIDNVDQAVKFINSRPKPLALYIFTKSKNTENTVLNRTSSGGVGINNVITHVASKYLPFGGVGPSGIGSYHGKESYETFTHRKSVMSGSNWLDLKMAYPGKKPSLHFIKKIIR